MMMCFRPVGFIMNMTARVVAKMACWSRELMSGSDLQFYLTWLKDQLRAPVRQTANISFIVCFTHPIPFLRATSTSRAWPAASR